MKQLFFLMLLTATFFSCKKDETTNVAPKKTYTVEYSISYVGDPLSQCTLYFIKNGVTYNQVLTVPSNQVKVDWSTSFTASSGDYVSMNAAPPINNSVLLTIKYNGNYLTSAYSKWPDVANANGNLP
jgi:hypothetical protein